MKLFREGAASTAAVTVGLALLAMSAAGFSAIDSRLRVVAQDAASSEVRYEGAPYHSYGSRPCPREADRTTNPKPPEV